MNKIITVENLIKTYKKAEKNAVDGISFTVDEGEFFTLLGPNGAGKTTTISILTTTLAKTTGKITIAGHDLDKESSKVRQNIGVIFQKPSLDMALSAEENIRFHAILYGKYTFRPFFSMMPKEYRDEVYMLAELLDIKDSIFKPIKTFSGGMKRKLEIIRGLMHNPKVLFLDEPTTGIDPVSRKTLWHYLNQIRKENNVTIFLTTHYLEEAESADHLCIINHGKIVAYGSTDDIKRKLIEKHIIADSKDRGALKAELTKLNLKFTEQENILIEIGDRDPQDIIHSIKTKLSLLKIQDPTVEEAYLKIISDENVH